MTAVGAGAVFGATRTDDAGPILAFVGALMVALLTAYTADRRQREQLAHDRALHQWDSLRDLLVRASSLMFAQTRPLSRLGRIAEKGTGQFSDEQSMQAREATREVQAGYPDVSRLSGELLIHYEPDDPIYVAFATYTGAASDAVKKLLEEPTPTAEELDEYLIEAREIMGQSVKDFRRAARREISQPDEG